MSEPNPALDASIGKLTNLLAPAFRATSPLTEQQVWHWLKDVLPKEGNELVVPVVVEQLVTLLVQQVNALRPQHH